MFLVIDVLSNPTRPSVQITLNNQDLRNTLYQDFIGSLVIDPHMDSFYDNKKWTASGNA